MICMYVCYVLFDKYSNTCVAFAWPIMGKYDVIHKPEVRNVSRHGPRITELRQELTFTENVVTFGQAALVEH